MSFSNINASQPQFDPGFSSPSEATVANAASMIIGIQKKRVKIERSRVKDIAKGLSEIAFSMGQTNEAEEYAEMMAEDIWEGLKLAEKRRKSKQKLS